MLSFDILPGTHVGYSLIPDMKLIQGKNAIHGTRTPILHVRLEWMDKQHVRHVERHWDYFEEFGLYDATE